MLRLEDIQITSKSLNPETKRASSSKEIKFGTSLSDASKYLIKENPTDLTINEYVSGRLYQKFISSDLIPEMHVINSSNPMLAIRWLDNFKVFRHGKYDNDGFPAWCVNRNCKITEEKPSFKQYKGNFRPSILNGKKITGFELASLTTLLMYDEDVTDLNNYGLIEKEDAFHVIRIDYDDSFRFFEKFEITEFPPPNDHAIIALRFLNLSLEKAIAQFRENAGPYDNANARALYFSLGAMFQNKKLNAENYLATLGKINNIPREEILQVIDDSFSEVRKVFTDEDISKVYDTDKMLCQEENYQYLTAIDKKTEFQPNQYCEVKEEDSDIDRLVKFTKYMMNRRLDDFNKMEQCLKAERALENNNADQMQEFISTIANAKELDNIICHSFYNPTKGHYSETSRDDFVLSNITTALNYNNEASKLFDDFIIPYHYEIFMTDFNIYNSGTNTNWDIDIFHQE